MLYRKPPLTFDRSLSHDSWRWSISEIEAQIALITKPGKLRGSRSHTAVLIPIRQLDTVKDFRVNHR